MDLSQVGFWSVEVCELLQQMQTPPEGLSAEEAGRRLAQYSPNLLKPKTRSGTIGLLLGQFKSPIVPILISSRLGLPDGLPEASEGVRFLNSLANRMEAA